MTAATKKYCCHTDAFITLHYSVVDIDTKSVQTKTQILTKLTGHRVVGGASKTQQRNFLLSSFRRILARFTIKRVPSLAATRIS